MNFLNENPENVPNLKRPFERTFSKRIITPKGVTSDEKATLELAESGVFLKDKIDNEEYGPNQEEIAQVIILNPNEYKADKEEEEKLNEFRELAGISAKKVYTDDAYTKYIKSLAGM